MCLRDFKTQGQEVIRVFLLVQKKKKVFYSLFPFFFVCSLAPSLRKGEKKFSIFCAYASDGRKTFPHFMCLPLEKKKTGLETRGKKNQMLFFDETKKRKSKGFNFLGQFFFFCAHPFCLEFVAFFCFVWMIRFFVLVHFFQNSR